jgi:hypothetical protein
MVDCMRVHDSMRLMTQPVALCMCMHGRLHARAIENAAYDTCCGVDGYGVDMALYVAYIEHRKKGKT